jgi:hypothetical protein
MGLSDDYVLPSNCNESYGLMGDGVVVPVVRHLAEHIIEPVLEASTQSRPDVESRHMIAVASATLTRTGAGSRCRR